MHVITGEQLHSRFGGGEKEVSSGNTIQIVLLNIHSGQAGGGGDGTMFTTAGKCGDQNPPGDKDISIYGITG